MSPTTERDAALSVQEPLGQVIGRLRYRFTGENADAGEIAELRRLAWGNLTPAFWRVLAKEIKDEDIRSERRWAALLTLFAWLAPLGSGQNKRIGTVLAEAKYNERRLLRLLRADDDQIHDELVTVARWLVAKGHAADWLEFARFTLFRSPNDGSNRPSARTIARDYYTALSRTEGPES